jgi:hypothetical protein
MSLRRRIEKSELLASALAACAGSYLSFCNHTTKWQIEGQDELKSALAEGPVLLIMWHSRSVMGALHWPVDTAPLSSLYDKSPIGRVSGALQRRVGLQPMEMSRKLSNRVASRTILRRVKEGVSIGMTADGPLGPALLVKDAPLEWARTTGLPVFCYAFSTSKSRRLSSWDQMMVPKPFGNGAFVFQRARGLSAARKMTTDELETLRTNLQKTLTDAAHRADALADVAPGA